MSRSGRSVQSDRIPPSQRSNSDQPRWERPTNHGPVTRDQRGYRPNRDRRALASNGRPSSHGSARIQYSRPSTVEKQSFSEKCSNLCSRRGVLQFVEITAGVLVLICVVASYAVITGYTSAAGLGSFSINSAYSPFEGNELQQVRDADMQYSQLRAPGVYGGVAFSILLFALTIIFLILGAKPIHRVSIRILFAELIFDSLAFIGYIVAVGLYLHFIKQVNSTDTCKTRERLYAGRGYTWMNCEVQGGDAAVAIFGLIAACVYLPSAILCALYIRTVREFRRNHLAHEYSPPSHRDREHKLNRIPEEAQFHPGTFV
ncbi:MARVEL domain-containing protein 3-like [Rhinophrynus dorsalis]